MRYNSLPEDDMSLNELTDYYNPSFNSLSRRSSQFIAVANLLATIGNVISFCNDLT